MMNHNQSIGPDDYDELKMGNSSNTTRRLKSPTSRKETTTSTRLEPPKTNFRMTARNQQSHRQPLYCIAWSSDIHADEDGKQYRYLATCGSKQLTVYEIECDNPRGTFEAKQFYKDKESEEHFYACAYGGRSKYWGAICLEESDEESSRDDSRDGGGGGEDGDDDGHGSDVAVAEVGVDKSEINHAKKEEDADNNNVNGRRKTRSSLSLADNNSVASKSSLNSSNSRKRPRHNEPEEVTETLILESESQDKMNYMGLKEKPYSSRGPQLICVAGASAVIKVVDPVQRCQLTTLQGHGSDVYDLKISPSNEFLLLSASVDESIRLWNLQSFACVAIFAGHHGHRESILSISWHPLGSKFASSGMDKSIRLWTIDDRNISEALQASQTSESAGQIGRPSFHPVNSQFPYFATTKVHLNFVDCVQFVGDLVLSKSTYNIIVLWMPKLDDEKNGVTNQSAAYTPPSDVIALRTFELDNCNIWFVRFAADNMGRLLAVGNIEGKIDIWDIDSCKKHPTCSLKAVNASTIRTLSFSPEGTTLISCNDQASVFKWEAY